MCGAFNTRACLEMSEEGASLTGSHVRWRFQARQTGSGDAELSAYRWRPCCCAVATVPTHQLADFGQHLLVAHLSVVARLVALPQKASLVTATCLNMPATVRAHSQQVPHRPGGPAALHIAGRHASGQIVGSLVRKSLDKTGKARSKHAVHLPGHCKSKELRS